MKRAIKYTTWVLVCLLILLVALMAFTQTAAFRNLLRTKVVAITNANLNGQLNVGNIEGNLFKQITLSDLSLKEGDSVIIAIDSVKINYRLAPLLRKTLVIDSLCVYSPQVNLWYKDSTTLNIVYAFQTKTEKENSTSSRLPIKIEGEAVQLINGKGSYQIKYGKAPLEYDEVNLSGKAMVADGCLDVRVDDLAIEAKQPRLSLEHSFAQFQLEGKRLQVDSLNLQTAQSGLSLKGWYAATDSFNVTMNGIPLNQSEVQSFVPNFPLKTVPKLNVELVSEAGELKGEVTLINDNKSLDVKGTIYDLSGYLENKEIDAAYDLSLVFRQFVPEEWFDIMHTGAKINGSVVVQGDDVSDYRNAIRLQANLNQSMYNELVVDTLKLDVIQQHNKVKADVLLVYNNSKSEGHLVVQDLYNVPLYQADFVTRNLDLEAIVPSVKNTVVNGHIVVSGTHILSEPRSFDAEAMLSKSRVFDFPIDSVYLLANLSSAMLSLDSCVVEAHHNKVIGSGFYNFTDKNYEADLYLKSGGLRGLENIGIPTVNYTSGESELLINGAENHLNYNGTLHLENINYQNWYCDILSANIDGRIEPDSILVAGDLLIEDLKQEENQVMDTVEAQFSYYNKHLWSSISFTYINELDGVVESDIYLNDTVQLELNEAKLNLSDATYYLTDTLQSICYFDKQLMVDNLEVNDQLDSSFSWRSHGFLSVNDSSAFELDVNNFQLKQLNRLIGNQDSINGSLSLQAKVSGRLNNIGLKGGYELVQPEYGALLLPDAKGEVNFKADTFKLTSWLPQLDSSLYANASIPIDVGVDTTGNVSWKQPKTFEATVMVDSLQLKIPDVPEYSFLKAGAMLNGVVNAEGEFIKPQFYGQLTLKDGYLTNYKRGVYYNDVSAVFGLDGNKLSIDTLFVGSNKGYLSSKGQISFDSTLVSGRVIASDLITDMKDFHLVNHKNYDINISGNPYYQADSIGHPQFGGKLLVNRSFFYIPGLVGAEKKQEHLKDMPLLVLAIQETDSTYEQKEADKVEAENPLLKQLRGRLTVEIPRSTWIKGENMNIEIGGDFDVAKTGDYFELFGDVDIIRGSYILYGRKFNIEEGVISFVGGEKTDPRLDINAEYVFRGGDREKHTLKLSVTEYLSEPTISFALDGDAISESDAVSIMVFGKTMDELNYAGQNGIIGSVGSNMLTSIVTSSLNSTIGQRFKLDMIEVNATENWTSAAFVVGKYITNDLFVIYQRGFGETEDDEITPETITLEYELNKLLFIRLIGGSSKSSGFDVILKFESTK